jgi:hypothetical protein
MICSCCGIKSEIAQIEKAHVKDKSEMIRLGIKDHTRLNLIELCVSCHILFDNNGRRARMGIKEIDGKMFFIKLDESNLIQIVRAKNNINVLAEYISWKNERVDLRLYKTLNAV